LPAVFGVTPKTFWACERTIWGIGHAPEPVGETGATGTGRAPFSTHGDTTW
jgi:hypothetical protein